MNSHSPSLLALLAWMISFGIIFPNTGGTANQELHLNLRSRITSRENTNQFVVVNKKEVWPAQKTALIVCDMWDDHWCKSAASRVTELAGPMNDVVKTARAKGVFIIHSPSSVMDFYKNSPQRKRAMAAPFVRTSRPLTSAERWGTTWCWPDPTREGALPIDDSDMGCDCAVKCTIRDAWTRQISTIQIDAADAVTDNGQETFNLLAEHGIDHVILMGVHLNMCVLGRPFGIRQMAQQGKTVALMRDMTDTMYNHEKAPQVSHFRGTELVIEHVEKFWCPSLTSSDLTGKPAFHFKDDPGARP